MKYMLIAQCNGNFDIIGYLDWFLIHFAFTMQSCLPWVPSPKLQSWHKGSASTIDQPKREEVRAFVFSRKLSVVTGECDGNF